MNSVLTLPNIITIFRIFLVLPVVLSLIDEKFKIATVLFIVAVLSDMLDGFIARNFNKTTKLGAILDPLADKLLLNYTFIVLTVKGFIPQLLLGVVLLKDLILISGSVVEVLSAKQIDQIRIKASLSGKTATFFQVLVVFLIFLKVFEIYSNKTVFNITVYSAIVLSIISLISYVNQYRERNSLL
ncbi:CDP-diacylglycerol--glycerol-3-phosphate 3-phosphatidyltransferase [Hippea alviniae]|uniref:CDP-diacylglycerol--glycerol-3-phosphate 3-phosphatidyltransferase n=1 Tax=Hippea alviniae TaxID=1279027 RepID=UPI0003B76ED5|nr:CDP-diacylglycerol--glycerol-3-phosphate 3-phosphatidyltransferase [Hippea alviniae]